MDKTTVVGAFGEMLIRLSSPLGSSLDSRFTLTADYGGTEGNVLIALSSLGETSRYLTVLPTNYLGDGAIEHMKRYGVDVSCVKRKPGRFGVYYFDANQKDRVSSTIYDRGDSAINHFSFSAKETEAFFAGMSWFHFSGIDLSLSEKMANTALYLAKEAKKRGVRVSFDFNYRGALCNVEKARSVYPKALALADVVFADEWDLMNIASPGLTADSARKKFFGRFPATYLFSVEKQYPRDGFVEIEARYYERNGIFCALPPIVLSRVGRIGCGDAFDGGVIKILSHDFSNSKRALEVGNACYSLKCGNDRDVFSFSAHEVEAFFKKRQMAANSPEKRTRIVLSVSKLDAAFSKMVDDLSRESDVEVVPLSGYSLKGCDIFIGKKLSRETLRSADCLKAVFAYKTGVDGFPLQDMMEKGVVLCNSHADSAIIAEYALALSSALTHRVVEGDRWMREGKWQEKSNRYWVSLRQLKIGLLGYGHIGKAIQTMCQRFGIETFTIDRGHDYSGVTPVPDLFTLVDRSDLVISSLPATKGTKGILNDAVFSRMKGKYLVDVGRSDDIDLADLYSALKQKTLKGAAIDGWSQSPSNRASVQYPFPSNDLPFQKLDNVILSPHAATQTSEGHAAYVTDITSNVLSYLWTGDLKNVVNLKEGY
ncbi:MAG: PfkB family carbohydrate kinase [Bacilli bacterium]|jgi:2-dehydro-3-deoxygluconokinase|nr:PfkB family carbohydrate kinase [Bacilli bacterium]